MRRPPRNYLFAGPSLHRGLAARLPFALEDFVVLPPARRGDVERILEISSPGMAVIVDGYFHLEVLAIGHAELARAISAGWQVWGLASMGAIRAAELSSAGMRGYGRVFARYASDPQFRDDEVALLHESEPPYRAFSEPLVHLRAGVEALVDDRVLRSGDRDAIVADLAARWFGERTLDLAVSLVAAHIGAEAAARWRTRFDEFQWKSRDLSEFLEMRPWRNRHED